MTVAGGMGLSFFHDSVFSNPTPVRAQVIGPAPVVKRAVAVRPQDVPQKKAVTLARASGDHALPEIEYAVIEPDAPRLALRGEAETVEGSVVPTSLKTPLISLRPKLRGDAPAVETRSARLTPALTRRVDRKPRVRAEVQRAIPLPIEVTAQRSFPQQVRSARRSLPPSVLIGVYR